MSTRGIDPNNFAYYPPNFAQDVEQNKGYVFLGSFSERPTANDFPPESLRGLITKTNFEAKKGLYKLGSVVILQKTTLGWYHWKVIKVTIQTLCFELWQSPKTAFFFLVGVPLAICFFEFKCDNIIADVMSLGLECFEVLFLLYLFNVARQAQGAYIDQYLAFQPLSQIPNSMEGFNLDQLANSKSDEGWEDPISLETIPADQISSSKILCIGRYALSIQAALTSMLTRLNKECPRGEIPHPIEQRKLTPDEKAKFLQEIAAFFAIVNPEALEACWRVQFTPQEVDSWITSEIAHWNRIPAVLRTPIYDEISQQLLLFNRKQAFLELLPDSVAREYFDDQFRSLVIPIWYPTEEEILQMQQEAIREILPDLILSVAQRVWQQNLQYHILTSTSGQ